jgi:hypothetical protein
LFQRRHLIVHRRGRVDAQYLESTKEALAPGTKLEITFKELIEYMTIVRDAGTQMIHAVASTLSEPKAP